MSSQDTDIFLLADLIMLSLVIRSLPLAVGDSVTTGPKQGSAQPKQKLGAFVDNLEGEENHQIPILNIAGLERQNNAILQSHQEERKL